VAGFDVALALEYHDTEGYYRQIDNDLQTIYDENFGTNVSLAPGSVNLQQRNLDANLDIFGLCSLESNTSKSKGLDSKALRYDNEGSASVKKRLKNHDRL